MFVSFVLFLREGLEAFLIVTILFAALSQLKLNKQYKAVWVGIGFAVILSLVGGIVLYETIHQYNGSTFQTIFETTTYLLAVVLLTSMTFWMQSHIRDIKKDILKRARISTSSLGLMLLAFTTVGREGVETAIFTLAFVFKTNALSLLTGAILGLLTAMIICFFIYIYGYKLNYRIFFRIMGSMLIIFAAGLLGDAIQNMQQLHWIQFGTQPLWHSAKVLSENSTIGDMLHSFLGYAESPTVLQCSIYTLYLLITGSIFLWMTRNRKKYPLPKSHLDNIPQ
jgi:high-affinity iron transporter